LERRFAIDLSALEHEFHRLSRKVHPDRFARADENERQWSLADTALLNDAYRTLKDSLHRTEYLLKLEGAELAAEDVREQGKNARVPADLLEEVFELNMQLEEMRAARATGEADAALEASLTQAREKYHVLLEAVDEDLRAEWEVWDEGSRAARSSAQKRLVALLDRRRYLSNLVRDVNEVLGA